MELDSPDPPPIIARRNPCHKKEARMFTTQYPPGPSSIFAGHSRQCPHERTEEADGKTICLDCGEQLKPAPDPDGNAELERLFQEGRPQ